jgi:putative ABC transport system substrate-binding protein
MDRRTYIAGVTTFLAWLGTTEAQQTNTKLPRIGLLGHAADRSGPTVRLFEDALREGLREYGLVEGQNIVIDYRYGSLEALPRLASDLVRAGVDVIFAGGTAAGLAAKRATASVPIVVAAMADPVADGLVTSLAKPGGNVTGVTFLGPELGPKRLQLLKEAVPGLTRVAVLQHPMVYSESTMREMLRAVRAVAAGIELQVLEARSPNEFDAAFATMARAKVNAVIALPSPMFYAEHRHLVAAANAHRLPTIYWFKEAIEAGGLMYHGSNFPDVFRRSAGYVAKILRGANPGDLPVEQPVKFDFGVNLKSAKALGLTIPPSLLLRADQIIE